MKTDTPKTYALVSPEEKGHEFVNGNTKHLKAMNQKDLAVLFSNGDPRVKIKEETPAPSDSKKPAAAAITA